MTSDLRRHLKTHDNARNQAKGDKVKTAKDKKVKLIKAEVLDQSQRPEQTDRSDEPSSDSQPSQISPKSVKKPAAATIKTAVVKDVDKKPARKAAILRKDIAPNVTIGHRLENGQYKMSTEYTNNVEVFDTRQVNGEYNKFKEIYSSTEEFDKQDASIVNGTFKSKEPFNGQIGYKESELVMAEERELAVLRPMFGRTNGLVEGGETEKNFTNRSENTDGKMQVFTHVEKGLGPRAEVKPDLQGEAMSENTFFERLSALYNIPAM